MHFEQVRDFFYQRQNYLHELDTAAEDMTVRLRMHRADLARDPRSEYAALLRAGREAEAVLA